MSLPQGDLRLLEGDVARRLLSSTLPARVAYTSTDGTPRLVPTWFQWTGVELAMPTFIAAPHVRRPAGRLRAMRANPDVAISIDTEGSPPEVLLVRGRAEISEVDGVDPDYAAAARRYMGEQAAEEYLQQITHPAQFDEHRPQELAEIGIGRRRDRKAVRSGNDHFRGPSTPNSRQ